MLIRMLSVVIIVVVVVVAVVVVVVPGAGEYDKAQDLCWLALLQESLQLVFSCIGTGIVTFGHRQCHVCLGEGPRVKATILVYNEDRLILEAHMQEVLKWN